MRQAALEYAARGWHLIPVWWVERDNGSAPVCGCGDPFCRNAGKHPLITLGAGLANASCDVNVVGGWWDTWPQANIAVATGRRSGVVVLDLDLGHATFQDSFGNEVPVDGAQSLEDWASGGVTVPATLTQETGSGGRHLIFRYPDDDGPAIRNVVGWLPGVDVRSDGGYVLVAPSGHISGNVYRWLNDQPVADLGDLLGHLRVARGTVGGGRASGSAHDLPVYDYREACRTGPGLGYRDDFFNRRAFELRKQDVPWTDAQDEIRRVWELAAQTDRDVFTWDQALAKLTRVWAEVEPEPLPTWDPFTAAGGPPQPPPPINPLDPPEDRLTGVGNANRFIRLHGDRVRYSSALGWLVWNGDLWSMDDTELATHLAKDVAISLWREAITEADEETRNALRAWAKRTEEASAIENLLKLARSSPELAIRVADLDVDPWLLAVANGVIDLRTGGLRPALQADMLTRRSGITYDPHARSQTWETFLHDATRGDVELQAYLQRAAGYTLTGSTAEEKLFLIYGPPATGKSTFIDAMITCLGDGMAMTIQADDILSIRGKQTKEHIIAEMRGHRMISTVEMPQGARFAQALIKQMTGRDLLRGAFKYKNSFQFRPTFKLWIATNHAPAVHDDDEGMWRRLQRVPFTNVIPHNRRSAALKDALQDPTSEVARAALAWTVAGCLAWQRHGLGSCAAVEADTHEYRQEQDKLGHFLETYCYATDDREWCTLLTDLYEAHKAWSREVGEREITMQLLSQKLKDRGLVKRRTATGMAFQGIACRTRDVYTGRVM